MTESGNYREVANITLKYYDKTYRYGLTKRNQDSIHALEVHSHSANENADRILDFCKEHNLV